MAPEGRQMHLNPSSPALIGKMCVKLAADNMPDGGEVAILSATATATNQNTWIEEMKKVLPNYPKHQARRHRLWRRPCRQVLSRDARA